MRHSVKLMAAAVLAFGFMGAPKSHAQITNGGFETGDLTGWSKVGDVSVQDSDFNPPQGSNIAFLNNDSTGQNVYDGVPATTDVAALDTFAGLSAGTLEGMNAKGGSEMQQTFNATAGNTISFDFNFLTNEPGAAGNQDFAFYTLQGPGISPVTVTVLADPTAPAGSPPPLTPSEAGIFNYLNGGTGTETGNLGSLFGITATGSYTLTFGVVNVGDTNGSSGLLIDNVTGASSSSSGGGGGSSVPLPAAALLAPAALALAGRYTAKLRKQA